MQKNNMIIVGSVGRGTAIKNISDWDCIYELPIEVYNRFNRYTGNGQSYLLQEIKNLIKETYPSTDIKGDGQVVVISFTDGKIELVPGFKRENNSYCFPNTNNGGEWKITKPIIEKEFAEQMAIKTNNNYLNICRIIRMWKNTVGFKFKGLLIDSLIYKYFKEGKIRYNITFDDYYEVIKDVFRLFALEDETQKYWYALGSNQQIKNDLENKRFVKIAKNTYKRLEKSIDPLSVLRDILGNRFAKSEILRANIAPNEQFIEDEFKVDIRYSIGLNCEITQDGFRPRNLKDFLKNGWYLKNNKKLMFQVTNETIPIKLFSRVVWYWKVRNIGSEAKRRNMERGQIEMGDSYKKETSNFNGRHYVECYAVINEVVVARKRIKVPIKIEEGLD